MEVVSNYSDMLFDLNFAKSNKKIKYANVPCAMDIETSSFYQNNNLENKHVITYAIIFGIDNKMILFRTWKQFIYLINKLIKYHSLNKEKRLIIYVHNLGYEFQFMYKYFKWENVFAVKPRQVLYALTTKGIEFRCSYLLSGCNLKHLGDSLKTPIPKMVGDLDYFKIRTPLTPLSDKELKYIYNDCLIVLKYIEEQIKENKFIFNIPLTKTGKVRRYCKRNCYYEKNKKIKTRKYEKYSNIMKGLVLNDYEEYELLKSAFMGGFTHANSGFVGSVVKNVKSFDFTSSYPYAIVSEKYPMGKGEYYFPKNKKDLSFQFQNYACVFEITFFNIKSKVSFDNIISDSKCKILKGAIINNGRVYSADMLTITITDIDFNMYYNFYSWEKTIISKFIRYKKGYLPTDFIKSILKLYSDKTTLKGIPGKEFDYALSKELLNSCYGMMVTDICKSDLIFENGVWTTKQPNFEKLIKKYNNSKNRFLFYSWGIFVTAYARRNLFTGILEFNEDYIYSDTDSIKVINADKHAEYFEKYNKIVETKLKKACIYHGIDYSLCEPLTINKEKKILGVWEHDGDYSKFKTLGAKRYLVEKFKNGKVEHVLTCSGLNKVIAVEYMEQLATSKGVDIFEIFSQNLYIPQGKTGKQTHAYINEEMVGTVCDYLGVEYVYKELSGVHLEDSDYSLSLAEEFIKFLKGYTTIEK